MRASLHRVRLSRLSSPDARSGGPESMIQWNKNGFRVPAFGRPRNDEESKNRGNARETSRRDTPMGVGRDHAVGARRRATRSRRRSRIPTGRSASSSASRPAAAPTSWRARSPPSSAAISATTSSSRTAPAPTARSPPSSWRSRSPTATRCCIPAPRSPARRSCTRTSASTCCAISRRSRPSACSTAIWCWSIRRCPIRIDRRIHRLREEQPRALRLARRRQPAAPRGRAVQRQGRREDGACALQGRLGGADRAAAGQHPGDVRHADLGRGPGQGGQAARAGHDAAPSRSRSFPICRC